MKKEQQAILLKVSERKDGEIVTHPKTLEGIQKLLQVDTIDIVRRKINGKNYCIIYDKEGLLKDNPIISGISNTGYVSFVGNLLICSGRNTSDGEIIGLNAREIENVLNSIKRINGYYVLFNTDY